MAIQKCIKRIVAQSDSILVVNSVNETIDVPKTTVNLVEDIKCLLACLLIVKLNIIIGLSIGMLMLCSKRLMYILLLYVVLVERNIYFSFKKKKL